FSLIVSDTTGNVKKARRLICEKWPWILNCPDPCHQLNLLMKDIMVGFAEVMTVVSTITTYFSHSNYGQHHLAKEMKKEKDSRGIQAAGATRFSSFSINAKSVACCFSGIQRCFAAGVLPFETKATKAIIKYLETGADSFKFQAQLHHANMLLTPIARGLETLEGQNTTLSDVFAIFIGIAVGFTCVFQDPSDSIREYQKETYATFNRRFAIFMNECTTDMFLLAYVFDP
ncbi:hypothetical protein C8J56DRAFT_716091, partial [Mycena floridula]